MAAKADGEEGQKEAAKSAPRRWPIGPKAILAIAVVAIVVIASAVVLYSGNKPEEKGTPSAAGSVTDVNMTSVAIPLTEISQTAKWYEYNVSGSTVRFFVVMDGNGAIHSAFDECWMCWNAHLGYRQNGTSMIENCCNMSFPISDITEQGCSGDGCCPIFLPSKVIGDQLSIRKSDLAKQKLIFISTDEAGNVHAYNSTHVAISLSSVGENATWYQY
ncbi:MAG: DUF2318 domain-containing protein, partial [Methanomassiliicoccales archaeon]|nr:DUF2318 domain-containing protein [Methanomassiliicoccales archaeon]